MCFQNAFLFPRWYLGIHSCFHFLLLLICLSPESNPKKRRLNCSVFGTHSDLVLSIDSLRYTRGTISLPYFGLRVIIKVLRSLKRFMPEYFQRPITHCEQCRLNFKQYRLMATSPFQNVKVLFSIYTACPYSPPIL